MMMHGKTATQTFSLKHRFFNCFFFLVNVRFIWAFKNNSKQSEKGKIAHRSIKIGAYMIKTPRGHS